MFSNYHRQKHFPDQLTEVIFTQSRKHLDALDAEIRKSKSNKQLKLLRMNYIIQSLSLLEVVKAKYDRLSKSHQNIKKLLLEEFRR